jgi:hypothetical protein
MALSTHLLTKLTPGGHTGRLETACGRAGIPITTTRPFYESDNRFEGRIPGSAGCGVVAVREAIFAVPNRGDYYCNRCMRRWQKGEGI